MKLGNTYTGNVERHGHSFGRTELADKISVDLDEAFTGLRRRGTSENNIGQQVNNDLRQKTWKSLPR